MWKAWWRESKAASVEPFWRRLSSSGGRGWDRFSGTNPVTHPSAPQTSPTTPLSLRFHLKIYMSRDERFHTMRCDHHTSAHMKQCIIHQRLCDNIHLKNSALCTMEWFKSMMLCNLKNILSHMCCTFVCLFVCAGGTFGFSHWSLHGSHWPKLPVAALLGSSLVNTSLSCTCGSVMHLQPRGFLWPLQSTFPRKPSDLSITVPQDTQQGFYTQPVLFDFRFLSRWLTLCF